MVYVFTKNYKNKVDILLFPFGKTARFWRVKIYLYQGKTVGSGCIHFYNIKVNNCSRTLISEKFQPK